MSHRVLLSFLPLSMNFLVALCTERHQIIGRVISQSAAQVNVMDMKMLHAPLATRPGHCREDEILRPRSRDHLPALSAAYSKDAERSRRLLEFFDSGQAVLLEPLSLEQIAVLRALFSVMHIRKDYTSFRTGI